MIQEKEMDKDKNRDIGNRRFLLHILQQIAAFIIALSFGFLIFYSFTFYDLSSQTSSSYEFDLLSREAEFEDTEVFDQMLTSSLHSIIRYNVAKSQMETNGKFDGSKKIDVAAFANRKNKENVTGKVSYTLEDLLKWGQYGVVYSVKDYTMQEFLNLYRIDNMDYDGYLTDAQKDALREAYDNQGEYQGNAKLESILNSNNQKFGNNMTAGTGNPESRMLQELAETIMSAPEAINGIYIEPGKEEIHVLCYTLQERYQPADGMSLMSHLDGLAEYCSYITYISDTISDLSYNYNEYLELKNSFSKENTNILFYFKMTMLGKQVEVSNLNKTVRLEDMDDYFMENCGKYVIYNPQNITLNTNTHILTVEEMFDALNSYEYAYPESARIWIGVDTSYPVSDIFSLASTVYQTFCTYRGIFMILGSVFLLLYLFLTLYLSVQAGRIRTQDGSTRIRLTWFDQIPTEIYLALVFAVVFFAVNLYYSCPDAGYVSRYRLYFTILTGFIGMCFSCFCCAFWYSFIRRFKKGTLLKGSICYIIWNKVFRKIFASFRRGVVNLYDNAGLLFRCVFVMGSVMAYNFLTGMILMFLFDYGRISWREFVLLFLLLVGTLDALAVYLWYHSKKTKKKLISDIKEIRDGNFTCQTDLRNLHGENLELAEAINSIGDSIKTAVETSMKDEKLKADLITNVSHDIKTPLTSIINYVDLLKREKIETQPVKGYIEILDAKSQRLKHLTEDLVEASKISSGNIVLHPEKIDVIELLHQTVGEFSERFDENKLTLVDGFSGEPVYILADSRRIYRVVENLFGNICKYAMPDTRVYVDRELTEDGKYVILSLKNISAQPLNIKAEELTQRFIRGDVSRSTEGSGLGLSIAKNLTELQNGKFEVYLDGDLFKVTLKFPVYAEDKAPERKE